MKKSDRDIWHQPHRVKKVVNLPPDEVKKLPPKKGYCIKTKGEHDWMWVQKRKDWDWYDERCSKCGKKRGWFAEDSMWCRKCRTELYWWNTTKVSPPVCKKCFKS